MLSFTLPYSYSHLTLLVRFLAMTLNIWYEGAPDTNPIIVTIKGYCNMTGTDNWLLVTNI
jgi:hypothetical protein